MFAKLRENYRTLGPRLFFRATLYGFSGGWLPMGYDPMAESWRRLGEMGEEHDEPDA